MYVELVRFLLHYHVLEHYVPPSVLRPLFEASKDKSTKEVWGDIVNPTTVAKKYYELTFKYSGRGDCLERGVLKEDKIADRVQCKAIAEIIYELFDFSGYCYTPLEKYREGEAPPEKAIFFRVVSHISALLNRFEKDVFYFLLDDFYDTTFLKEEWPGSNIFEIEHFRNLSNLVSEKTTEGFVNYSATLHKQSKVIPFKYKGVTLNEVEFLWSEVSVLDELFEYKKDSNGNKNAFNAFLKISKYKK